MVRFDGNIVMADDMVLDNDELRQAKRLSELVPVALSRGKEGELRIDPIKMESEWLIRQARRHRPVVPANGLLDNETFAHVTTKKLIATLEHIEREIPSSYITPMMRNDGIQWLPILVVWNILGKVEGYLDFNTGLLYLE